MCSYLKLLMQQNLYVYHIDFLMLMYEKWNNATDYFIKIIMFLMSRTSTYLHLFCLVSFSVHVTGINKKFQKQNVLLKNFPSMLR